MASWGLKDNVALTGTITTSDDIDIVQGFDTTFLEELQAGDYVILDGQKYQTDLVSSNTEFRLTSLASANLDNVTSTIQQGPKYIGNVDVEDNVYTIQRIYGVDSDEVNNPDNRIRNIKSPGWVHYQEYTDALGQTRYKTEVLVSLSKNFSADNAGDADDDDVVPNHSIFFVNQPEDNLDVADGSNVTFMVTADSTDNTAIIEYQWFESADNINFNSLSDDAIYSGTDTNTLEISDVTGLNNYFYRVVISHDDMFDKISNSVTLTITI